MAGRNYRRRPPEQVCAIDGCGNRFYGWKPRACRECQPELMADASAIVEVIRERRGPKRREPVATPGYNEFPEGY